MPRSESKVKFNLKNVHYAKITKEEDGVLTYGTPVHIPGAVNLNLEPQGELNPFYADGIVYYTTSTNNGYEGDLQIALIPDSFRVDILNEQKESDGTMWENVYSDPSEFAFGFEIDGDQSGTRFWFLKSTVSRPKTEAKTTEDTKEPATDTLTIKCMPNAGGFVRAKTSADTSDSNYENWFKSVPANPTAA